MNTRLLPYAIIVILLFGIIVLSCSSDRSTKDNDTTIRLENLRKEAIDSYMKGSFAKSDSLGERLFQEASAEQNDVYKAYALLIKGFYPKTSQNASQRLEFVRQAEKIALDINNDTLLSWVYNILGIYSTTYTFNFSEARHYYSEAIKYAKRGNLNQFRISAECNISELYYLFGDTLGIKYDLDIYSYAIAAQNPPLVIASARRIAEYYIDRKGEELKALPYIQDIKEAGNVYLSMLLRGKYFYALDSLDKAKSEFESALMQEIGSPKIYLSYAQVLSSLGDYRKSNTYLDSAYRSFREIEERGFDYIETMRLYSDNMHRLGNDSMALDFLERYISARDSVNLLRNREEINSYKVRFDVAKKELELAKNRETLKRQSITIWSIIVLISLASGFYLFYRLRRRSIHRLIVRQQRDFLKELPSSGILATQNDAEHGEEMRHELQNGIAESKSNDIWSRIQYEMDENKIYSDTTVTRDIFAERVGCNHTWFSQVIKDRTGKSYLQFMNSRRIKEAIKILSDPSSSVTLKELASHLGFLSASTFYSAFKQQVGMSPAEYRKLAHAEASINNRKK